MRGIRLVRVVLSVIAACAVLATWPAAGLLGAEDAPASQDIAREAQAASDAADDQAYEMMRLFVDVLDQIDRNYVEPVDRRQLMEAAIQGMMSKLDPYSNYIPPDQLDQFRSGVESEFGGVGLQISVDDGHLQIVGPLVGSPAYKAGLLAGDRITHIDGKSTKGMVQNDAIRHLKGPLGTKITLTVVHSDQQEPRQVELLRETVVVETVLGDRRDHEDRWQFMYDLEDKIGYIRVTSFGRRTARELRRSLLDLQRQELKGLILDLRYNPGGLLSEAIKVCDLFISKGRIVSTEGRNVSARSWDAHAQNTFDGFPMVVLVNRFSASASEIVAACLQDHKRAVIIGQRTWGKGSVQNIIDLEEGKSAMKLTTAAYHRPSGTNIHRAPGAGDDQPWGVIPDEGFNVMLSEEQMRDILRDRRQRDILKKQSDDEGQAGVEDPQLAKAVEYLRQAIIKDVPAEDSAATAALPVDGR